MQLGSQHEACIFFHQHNLLGTWSEASPCSRSLTGWVISAGVGEKGPVRGGVGTLLRLWLQLTWMPAIRSEENETCSLGGRKTHVAMSVPDRHLPSMLYCLEVREGALPTPPLALPALPTVAQVGAVTPAVSVRTRKGGVLRASQRFLIGLSPPGF